MDWSRAFVWHLTVASDARLCRAQLVASRAVKGDAFSTTAQRRRTSINKSSFVTTVSSRFRAFFFFILQAPRHGLVRSWIVDGSWADRI
ncbi:hypothetical protein BS50DRAFT_63060 [Corynespora cassiicola Philippines]|uniref:Uncharacterized protein n=1 Tax=Corynespora cassiicola Philippines TaxID=1448308 RepID=A0A2T2NJK2_CORCC|nr:hypothetical protein BS50DRAFT_63060 [Corynespora cassiicola Philippines]